MKYAELLLMLIYFFITTYAQYTQDRKIKDLQDKISAFNDHMDRIQIEGQFLPKSLYDSNGAEYVKVEGKYGEVMWRRGGE